MEKNPTFTTSDETWMELCLQLAERAQKLNEVPVGAIVVRDEELVGQGYNLRESKNNSLAHAELIAIEQACEKLGRWRLSDCRMYVSLEPCLMCAGAIINSRLQSLTFAATDPKAGAVVSIYRCLEDSRLNHQTEIRQGLFAQESSVLLSSFFQNLREQKKT